MKNELDRTKQNSASFKKMVYVQRDRVIHVFRSMYEQKKTMEQERRVCVFFFQLVRVGKVFEYFDIYWIHFLE